MQGKPPNRCSLQTLALNPAYLRDTSTSVSSQGMLLFAPPRELILTYDV
jgi:hypothetical protein